MILSAVEAIAPAIQRTKQFLFQPFRLGTYLKLCLVALLTEGFSSNFRSHGHGEETTHGPVLPPFTPTPLTIAAAIAMVLLALLIVLGIFYLITRLRFAFFHCLIHNSKQIRPGWHLYRSQADRFFWMNLAVGACFLLLILVVALPFLAGFLRLFREMSDTGRPDLPLILSLGLPLIPVILLLVLLGFAADIILRDFMLPHYALDNATAGQAWAAVRDRIAAEKGMFFGYARLRIVLPIIGVILLFALFVLPAVAFFAVFAVTGIGVHQAFADATGAMAFVRVFFEVLIGLVAFVLGVLITIACGGPLSTATRQYALLFYGARYQPLGILLFPPPPMPFAPPASAAPSPA